MSSGQRARTPKNFPRMKVRGVARRTRALDFYLMPWQARTLAAWIAEQPRGYVLRRGKMTDLGPEA